MKELKEKFADFIYFLLLPKEEVHSAVLIETLSSYIYSYCTFQNVSILILGIGLVYCLGELGGLKNLTTKIVETNKEVVKEFNQINESFKTSTDTMENLKKQTEILTDWCLDIDIPGFIKIGTSLPVFIQSYDVLENDFRNRLLPCIQEMDATHLENSELLRKRVVELSNTERFNILNRKTLELSKMTLEKKFPGAGKSLSSDE
jgi:hypothetical protein